MFFGRKSNRCTYSDEQVCSTAADLREGHSRPEDIPSGLRLRLAELFPNMVKEGLVLKPDAHSDAIERDEQMRLENAERFLDGVEGLRRQR